MVLTSLWRCRGGRRIRGGWPDIVAFCCRRAWLATRRTTHNRCCCASVTSVARSARVTERTTASLARKLAQEVQLTLASRGYNVGNCRAEEQGNIWCVSCVGLKQNQLSAMPVPRSELTLCTSRRQVASSPSFVCCCDLLLHLVRRLALKSGLLLGLSAPCQSARHLTSLVCRCELLAVTVARFRVPEDGRGKPGRAIFSSLQLLEIVQHPCCLGSCYAVQKRRLIFKTRLGHTRGRPRNVLASDPVHI